MRFFTTIFALVFSQAAFAQSTSIKDLNHDYFANVNSNGSLDVNLISSCNISADAPLVMTNTSGLNFVLSIPVADGADDGYLSSTDWTRFNGNTTPAFTVPLVNTAGTVTCNVASGSQPGCLSSANWTTFNGKQAALTPGSISTTTTGVTVGSGSSSTVGPNVTVDVQTASGSQPGLLSSANWTTFNGKQAAIAGNTLSTHNFGNSISAAGTLSGAQPACSDLSNAAASCSTDATNASNIGTGTLALARGGTGVDLSATGGTSQVLFQNSSHVISAAQPTCSTLSNAAASCSTDTTNPANITQDSTHRFVTDTDKANWNGYAYGFVPAATQTTSSSVAADITGFGFAVAASQVWGFEYSMQTGCNNTGGVKFDVTFPASAAVRMLCEGSAGGVTSVTSAVTATSGSLLGVAFNTVNSTGGRVNCHGTIINSTNAGTVQLQFASGTDTQTSTIFGGSYMRAFRIQ